ncbi:hypothetical protein KGF57_002507 [Candida theae]|uniref:Uncharacterized protein n=1 Tax=Candida theae TaxID=1198502 RepID=A0AAD5BFK3_9ASCO|nr:uncharacterized protein KGF57_002507 [Candida theae]KAI5958662.1 hypothetical protein KGF57_002507 [Candida theae]
MFLIGRSNQASAVCGRNINDPDYDPIDYVTSDSDSDSDSEEEGMQIENEFAIDSQHEPAPNNNLEPVEEKVTIENARRDQLRNFSGNT